VGGGGEGDCGDESAVLSVSEGRGRKRERGRRGGEREEVGWIVMVV